MKLHNSISDQQQRQRTIHPMDPMECLIKNFFFWLLITMTGLELFPLADRRLTLKLFKAKLQNLWALQTPRQGRPGTNEAGPETWRLFPPTQYFNSNLMLMNQVNLIWSLSLSVPAWQMKASSPHPVHGQNPSLSLARPNGASAQFACRWLTLEPLSSLGSGNITVLWECARVSRMPDRINQPPTLQAQRVWDRASAFNTFIIQHTVASPLSVPLFPRPPASFSPASLALSLHAVAAFCQQHSPLFLVFFFLFKMRLFEKCDFFFLCS